MLHTIFKAGGATFIPGCYDALTAKLVERAGFPAAYIGGSAIAASSLGLPDTGVVTLDDVVRSVKAAACAINVPLIADADHAFFDAANVWRAIHAFEDAGAFAIHIEDHAGGKHTELGTELVPLEAILGKLRAAMDARRGSGMSIIARTDAIWTGKGLPAAIERMKAFVEIGVDAVFPTFATPAMVADIISVIKCPIMVIDQAGSPTIGQWTGLADIVVDYGFCSGVTAKAVTNALSLASRSPADSGILDVTEKSEEFEKHLDYAGYITRSRKYSTSGR